MSKKMYRGWYGALALIFGATPSWSQTWSWPGCADVTDADFALTSIIRRGVAPDPNISEPVKMDFDMDAAGNVDIYYVERVTGNVKRFNAAANTMTLLGTVANWKGPYNLGGTVEEGLTGIVLDPNFKTNRYIYLHYEPAGATTFRISRFTLSGTALGSERVVLEFPSQRDYCCHTGGGMAFDAYGDLWISQGNNNNNGGGFVNETTKNSSDEWGATSTAGLRGGIIRIHPVATGTPAYTIPTDNFGEYFARTTGNAQYSNTTMVLPEIYAKGTRNAYSLTLDPVRRWVTWGNVGADLGLVTEEHELIKTPGFQGWPYFHGNNIPGWGGKIASAPTNTSRWNTGMTTLPPARPPIHYYQQSAAITGPIYRYDGDLVSSVKLPPHFTRKWFVTDFNNSQINVLTLDSMGTSFTALQRIFANRTFYAPLDFKTGPDGALYVLNYNGWFNAGANTGIVRISYTGACRPLNPKLEQPTGTYLNPGARYTSSPTGWVVNLQSGRPIFVPEGMAGFELFDMMGRKVWEIRHLQPGQSFNFPSHLSQGAMKYRWVSAGM